MGVKGLRTAIYLNAFFCIIMSFVLLGQPVAVIVLIFFNLIVYAGLRHALKKAYAKQATQIQQQKQKQLGYTATDVKEWN